MGRLSDVASFQDIPINEQPLLPNPCLPNQDSCWVLLHRYSQPMDYPELAAHIPADPLIVELPELFSNCFLIWIPLTDLTTIFFVFNHSSITQHSFFPHGIMIAAYTRKKRGG